MHVQPDEPEIASSWREAVHQRENHFNGGKIDVDREAPPKYVVNVDKVFDIGVHGVMVFDEGTVLLEMPDTMAFANHYRMDYRVNYGNESKDPTASTFDDFLAAEVPKILQALEERFCENPKDFLKRIGQRYPPSSQSIVSNNLVERI